MLPEQLIEELQGSMSLTRLAKIGLFQKMLVDDPDIEIKREVKLHRAVLDKALVDSFSNRDKIRKAVEYWLNLTNKEFRDACDRAVLAPDLVYRTFHLMKKILKGKNAQFPKYGKRKSQTEQRTPKS